MPEERTLLLVKPDAMHRGLAGEVISRFERKGFVIIGCKLMQITPELAGTHYAEHKGKPFYEGLVTFMTHSPVIALCVQGPRVIEVSRRMMGKTFAYLADPGTIRGDFGCSKGYNLVHGSDSPASAAREIGIFFKPEELIEWSRQGDPWFFNDEDRGQTSEA